MIRTFPLNLNIKDRHCLVVGGGTVAKRKVLSLLDCGAKVYIVSPTLVWELKELVEQVMVEWIDRHYHVSDLQSKFVVISATDNDYINDRVARDCSERDILVNVVDNAELSTFIMPATVRQGDLTIAVSTNGNSPLLAAKLCQQFRKDFGPEYAEFLEILGNLRQEVLANVSNPEQRLAIFASLVESDLLQLLKDKDETKVKERIDECISLR